ncbi:hypothetical protein B0H67DRAFT_680004 [Lasiosphaeris hirsuta]|uniref:EKC/KEOPS complex subunit BUD32 n=1 Tax=Lasiosphaeris hirsuta TaxID=260670 RepID=A0AA40AYN3_9PEZI|nr:hypothetical protein B0H67DRAFT_680004 [Lasiosphaeris hirsuta]
MEAAELRFTQFPTAFSRQPDGLRSVCFPIHDGDSRRWLRLNIVDVDDATHQLWSTSRSYSPWAPIHNALAAMIDSGRAPDATGVVMTADGTIISISSDVSKDVTPGTYYAPLDDYQLSSSSSSTTSTTTTKIATIPRDRLIELGRLAPFTDVVAPISSPSERLVFKHYEDGQVMTDVWYSIQIMAGMLGHPNIIPIRHVVLHEHSGGVVGFTMPFLAGGNLEATRASRTFKLKWAKQLFQALDDLNLQYGIDHRDIRLRNLMVDPVTDNLVIIDLGIARRRGLSGGTCVPPTASHPLIFLPLQSPKPTLQSPELLLSQPPEKQAVATIKMEKDADVNAAIIAVHDLVTRSPTDRSWETDSNLWNGEGIDTITAGPWTAHPDARLDSPAESYHAALDDWLRRRRADPRYRHGLSTPLDFPKHMPIPRGDSVRMLDYQCPLDTAGYKAVTQVLVSGYDFFRRDAVCAGRAVVDWTRPLTTTMDPARMLLATGQYTEGVPASRETS